MSRSKILFLLLLLSGTFCFAQKSILSYKPDNVDSLQLYIKAMSARKNKAFVAEKNQKEIQKIIDSQKESFLKDLKDSSYIFDKRINNYLKVVLKEIYKSNPAINPADFYFFIDKSPLPNAASYGNNIFTVNLGLLDVIQTDDELAFVICHEMAHEMLKHYDKKMVTLVQTANSKDTKKKMRVALNTKYGKRRAVYDVMKDFNYDFQHRSRTAETQADSLGFVFLSKTKYDKAAAAKSLKIMEVSDSLFFAIDPKLEKHFNFDAYPFKEAWISPDKTLFDLKEAADDYAWNKDSLKSHPDMPYRIGKLQKFYTGAETATTSPALAAIKKISSENSIVISIDNSRIDLALYQVLALSEKNEVDQKTYCNTIAYLLKKTYQLKENHNFGKYVDPVSPFSEEKYLNEVRLFLNHLELKNIRKIGLQFCLKYQTEMAGDADFIASTAFFNKLNPTN